MGICTDDLPSVFRHKESPFVDPVGEEDIQKAIDVIRRCPSGALCYSLGDSEEMVEEECDPGIQMERDGPYDVTGLVELKSSESVSYETRARYTLCRCGGSRNKPYCDGTHWHIGFRDGYGPEGVNPLLIGRSRLHRIECERRWIPKVEKTGHLPYHRA